MSLVISPGSSRILSKLAENGALAQMINAGARVIECACGPCIGMGQSPRSGGVSLRTFNRNFKGRSGTADADVYLVSPETAAISAITGVLTDGRKAGFDLPKVEDTVFEKNDNYMVYPVGCNKENTPLDMGPNIKPFPLNEPMSDEIEGSVVLVGEDNITTDDIMPSNAKLLPYRSNIPHLSNYCFATIDEGFPARCQIAEDGVIIAGANYGQGSSREHAALAPLYLGIRFVIAKSYARIHRANLINSGILPLVFSNPEDYDDFSLGHKLRIENAKEETGKQIVTVKNLDTGKVYETIGNFTAEEHAMLLAGGKINMIKKQENRGEK